MKSKPALVWKQPSSATNFWKVQRGCFEINSIDVDTASKGIGFHHAKINRHDRMLTEDLFRRGFIQVLCATSTLAVGVNFPGVCNLFASIRLRSNSTACYHQKHEELSRHQGLCRVLPTRCRSNARPRWPPTGISFKQRHS